MENYTSTIFPLLGFLLAADLSRKMRYIQRRNVVLLVKLFLTVSFVCGTLYLFSGIKKLLEKIGPETASASETRLLANLLVVEELDGYLVYPRVFSSAFTEINETLVLVSHTSDGHLRCLPALTRRWEAPISLAVFAPSLEIFSTLLRKISSLRACDDVVRSFVTFHMVTPSDFRQVEQPMVQSEVGREECQNFLKSFSRSDGEDSDNYALSVPYPNNLLRNVGRTYSNAEYILVLDIDMMPNSHLHHDFVAFLHNQPTSKPDARVAYVLPAFELATSSSDQAAKYPSAKSELLVLLGRMRVRPFYFEVCWPCQQPTDYTRWTALDSPESAPLQVAYHVEWLDPWEPFYITKNSAPLYDARFQQYGFNRISQACEVHMADYRFSVLNRAFVVHGGYKTKEAFHKSKNKENARNRLLYSAFKKELAVKYNTSQRTCD